MGNGGWGERVFNNVTEETLLSFLVLQNMLLGGGCSDQTFGLSDFLFEFEFNLNYFDMCIHIVRSAKDLIQQESCMGKVECAFS